MINKVLLFVHCNKFKVVNPPRRQLLCERVVPFVSNVCQSTKGSARIGAYGKQAVDTFHHPTQLDAHN